MTMSRHACASGKAGAAAYLPKPFAGATLLAAVRNAAGTA